MHACLHHSEYSGLLFGSWLEKSWVQIKSFLYPGESLLFGYREMLAAAPGACPGASCAAGSTAHGGLQRVSRGSLVRTREASCPVSHGT